MYYAPEAEEYVIGALVLDPRLLTVAHKFSMHESWFTVPMTNEAWKAIEWLNSMGKKVEYTAVLNRMLLMNPQVDKAALEYCIDNCTAPSNAMYYMHIIRDKAHKRELDIQFKLLQDKLGSELEATEIISEAQFMLEGFEKTDLNKKTPEEIAKDRTRLYLQAQKTGCVGIPSRWLPVQHWLGGFPPGKVVVLAGNTSQGKTTMACNQILYSARNNYRCGIITIEMFEEEIRSKLAADECKFDLHEFEQGNVSNAQIKQMEKVMLSQADLPILISDRSHTIRDVSNFVRDNDLDIVMIDYLQILSQHSSDPKAIVERISSWSTQIVNLAADTKTSIMLLSQLSRGCCRDKKGNPVEPQLEHLKGSGSIEQDAEKVVFVYQDPKYKNEDFNDNAPTKVKIAKHRGGKKGIADMVFKKSQNKLITIAEYEEEERV